MSENPYAPPRADLGSDPGAGAGGGRGDFEIGRCLSDAWSATWANFPLWLLVGLVAAVLLLLGVATIVGILLVVPVVVWGAAYFGLRMHDGRAEFGDLFAGFSRYGAALVGMLGCIVLITLVGMLGQSVQVAGQFTGDQTLTNVGVGVNLAFALLVTPRLTFAYFFVVEGASPMEALSSSWSVTSACKWKLVVLVLLGPVIVFAGLLALVVGVLPALTVLYLMWVSAYRQTVGTSATL